MLRCEQPVCCCALNALLCLPLPLLPPANVAGSEACLPDELTFHQALLSVLSASQISCNEPEPSCDCACADCGIRS